MTTIGSSLWALCPELILVGGGILVLLADLGTRRSARACLTAGAVVALASLYAVWLTHPTTEMPFGGQMTLDVLTQTGRLIVLGCLVMTLLVSQPYLASVALPPAEYTALLLFAAAGLSGVAASRHWLVLFIFLEISAIAFASLLGSRSDQHVAREASLKYFVLSAFASAFLLYGIALLWYSTGSFALGVPQSWGNLDRLALCCITVGLAFKCALVPFHMWAPDVYAGGPTPVVGFMAAASKTVGFLVLVRVLLEGGAVAAPGARFALWAVAAISIVTGTMLALTQQDVKRMLAYSGIAHAGYVATAFVAGGPDATGAVVAYLLVYAVMTTGAFAVLTAAESAGLPPTLAGLTGFARRAPLAAGALAVFMMSLTGLPPTAGFFAKFLVFRGVLQEGYLWLVLLAVLMSVVSVGFYLRLLVPVFMQPLPKDAPAAEPLAPEGVLVAVVLAAVLLLAGILPNALLTFGGLVAGQ